MFQIENQHTEKPIKIWLKEESQIEPECLEQAYRLSQLPFIHQWAALMPDTHRGMGMPIGGVIAAKDAIIPNAVGSDIGCGMAFCATNIPVSVLKETETGSGSLIQTMVGDILRSVPLGSRHHRRMQPSWVLDRAFDEYSLYESEGPLLGQLEAGYFQIGTLGGGNHFIELQEDDEGMLGIMIHSGSRGFGKNICDHFHGIARENREKWSSPVPDDWRLAYLPTDTKEGQSYIRWMNLALDFAQENRNAMMLTMKAIVEKWIGKSTDLTLSFTDEINCHHNYASLETHYGREVWVHRKGATRARKGERAVIPGAMGSYSYVVEGLGNPESFESSSHGAGRLYSRKAAMERFTTEQVMTDLNQSQVVLGKTSKKDVAEESRFAYKDIDQVMENQRDLVRPVKRLKTVGVVKG